MTPEDVIDDRGSMELSNQWTIRVPRMYPYSGSITSSSATASWYNPDTLFDKNLERQEMEPIETYEYYRREGSLLTVNGAGFVELDQRDFIIRGDFVFVDDEFRFITDRHYEHIRHLSDAIGYPEEVVSVFRNTTNEIAIGNHSYGVWQEVDPDSHITNYRHAFVGKEWVLVDRGIKFPVGIPCSVLIPPYAVDSHDFFCNERVTEDTNTHHNIADDLIFSGDVIITDEGMRMPKYQHIGRPLRECFPNGTIRRGANTSEGIANGTFGRWELIRSTYPLEVGDRVSSDQHRQPIVVTSENIEEVSSIRNSNFLVRRPRFKYHYIDPVRLFNAWSCISITHRWGCSFFNDNIVEDHSEIIKLGHLLQHISEGRSAGDYPYANPAMLGVIAGGYVKKFLYKPDVITDKIRLEFLKAYGLVVREEGGSFFVVKDENRCFVETKRLGSFSSGDTWQEAVDYILTKGVAV